VEEKKGKKKGLDGKFREKLLYMSFCFFLFSSLLCPRAPLLAVLFLSQKSFAVFLISGIEDGGCRKASRRGRRKGKDRKYIYQTCTRVRLYTEIQPQPKHGGVSFRFFLDNVRRLQAYG
jgi:hypothetical protein